MAWPSAGNFATDHLDAGTDDPSQARADLLAALEDLEDIIGARGIANGIASLDGSALIPTSELPVVPVSKGGTGSTSAADARTALGVQAALGYTPVNISGDTMIGPLNLSNGMTGTLLSISYNGAGTGPGSITLSSIGHNAAANEKLAEITMGGLDAYAIGRTFGSIAGYALDPTTALTGKVVISAAQTGFPVQSLTIGPGYIDVISGVSAGQIKVGGTAIVDASRNLTNIGTVGCGAITGTSTIAGTGFNATSGSYKIAGTDAITSARRGAFTGIDCSYDLKFTTYAAPTAPTVGAPVAGGSMATGQYYYKIVFVTANGKTELGTTSLVATVSTPGTQTIPLSNIPTGPTGVIAREIHRTKVGGSTYWLLTQINDNTTTTFNDVYADTSLGSVETTYLDNTTGWKLFSDTTQCGHIGPTVTRFGYNSGYGYITGGNLAGLGDNVLGALGAGLTGRDVTCVGHNAGSKLTSGIQNTFVGSLAGAAVTNGGADTFIGALAGQKIVSSTGVTAIGGGAASNTGTTTTGFVCIGYYAGADVTGNYNTFLGTQAGNTDGTNITTTNITYSMALGYKAQVQQSNACAIGGVGTFAMDLGITTMTPKAKLHAVGDVTVTGGYFVGGDATTKGSETIRSTGCHVNKVLAAAPSTPIAGQTYFNSGDSKLYVYTGSTWVGVTLA